MGEGGQKVHTSSYKMSPGHIMYTVVTIVNNTVLCICKLLRVNLKNSHYKKKFPTGDRW